MRFGDDSSLSREIIELLGEARSDIGDKTATIAKRKKINHRKESIKAKCDADVRRNTIYTRNKRNNDVF